MRLPTSDSKLFLFNEKKKRKKNTSCLLVWTERLADKTKGGGRGGGRTVSVQPCVYARGHGFVHLCVQACLQYQRRCPVCTSTTPAHLVLLHKTVWGGFYVHITYVHQVVR